MGQKLFRKDVFAERDGRLAVVGCKCRQCGVISFPKNDLCVFCLAEDMEEVEIDRKGVLYSYTITRRNVDKWQAPHPIGMIWIPDQKVSLVAPLMMEGDEDPFQCGEEMEMVITRYWDEGEDEVIGYKFRQVGKKEGTGDA